jgi:DNA-binding CsgD family transcriptional regulator
VGVAARVDHPVTAGAGRYRCPVSPGPVGRGSAGGDGDEGGDDVGGVTVEGLAGPVVAHRRARVGVTGCFLHIAQGHTGVQGGGDEAVAQAVRRDPLGDPGPTGEALDGAVNVLTACHAASTGASALTEAELRLLPFLATHLSFREIGERLHVSRHTVKSQAIAVCRKLGVASRSQAVQCAYRLGLLDP